MNTKFCITCKLQLSEDRFYIQKEILLLTKCKVCIERENNDIAADFKTMKEQKQKNPICL